MIRMRKLLKEKHNCWTQRENPSNQQKIKKNEILEKRYVLGIQINLSCIEGKTEKE